MKTLPACLAGIVSLSFPAAAQLVFTEIHYHPVEGPAFNADGTTCHHLTNDIHEFVEIQTPLARPWTSPAWKTMGQIRVLLTFERSQKQNVRR